MSERREMVRAGILLNIAVSIGRVLKEPIEYIQGAYWQLEQELGTTRARTVTMRRGGLVALFPVSTMSLGVILGVPLLTAVGGLAAGALGTTAVGTWVRMKLENNDGIQRVINGPSQPRQLKLIP